MNGSQLAPAQRAEMAMSRRRGESSSSSVSVLDCHVLVHALQGLCVSIQELANRPSNFVLHRTQCCCLSKSYNLAVRHVARQVHHALSMRQDPYAQENLLPSLSELYQSMLQGEKFMRDCLYQDGWVKKAMLLAFSSEAEDVCLHDLVWCLCVIQQATGELSMADDDQETDIYRHLNAVWSGTSGKEDLRILQEALEADYQSNETKAGPTNSNKNLNAQWRLARFLLQKVTRENDGRLSSNTLPQYYWVDPNEFVIKESIGHGASAVVYEVEWCGEIYGQKEFFGAEESLFCREATIQASLRHPNLLQLICCTTSKPSRNKCSLVMEMMDKDLRSMIGSRQEIGINPPFPLLTAVDLMLQIAKGMEYLHSLNIMHRDLKSFNILVSKQVSGYASSGDCRLRAKVADFGISRAKSQSSHFTPHVGTTYWRAPEVFNVHPECENQNQPTALYTFKADVYSFAMVCYEILSGNMPFDDGGKVGELYQRLIKGERPKLPSSCPQYLASYIERCWHGEPSKRPSFVQIARTLRHLKGNLLTSANPLSSLALSAQACTFIEDKLEQMMGSNWTSTTFPRVTSKSMTISFEMSWYQVMERKLIEEEEILAVESPTTTTQGMLPHTKATQANDSPKRRRKKGHLSKLVTWIVRRLLCSSMRKNHDKAEGSSRSNNISRMTQGCGKLNFPLAVESSTISRMTQANDRPKRGRIKGHSSKLVTWIVPRLLCSTRKNDDKEGSSRSNNIFPRLSHENGWFTYAELDSATHHFRASSLIGQGGSGSVYKGTLADGRVVAIKVMRERSRGIERDFLNELGLQLGKLHHRNLVPFLGFCSEGESLMLVYEYIPRGDLGSLMHAQGLSWAQRYNIACGLAAALNYLHHECSPQILHRDVKPSNVLLDDDYNARLADFGIARPVADDDSHVTTVVMGTMGYIAPEYFMTLKLGPEADIYSFGIVVLELATGRRFLEANGKNQDRISVIHHVWKLYLQGMLLDAGDARVQLESQYDEEKMKRLLLLGLACSQSDPGDRPTMSHVVQVLSGEVGPPTPAYPPYGMEHVRVQSHLSDRGPSRSGEATNSITDSTGSEGMVQAQDLDAESVEPPADEELFWSMESSDSLDDALL